MQKKKLVGQGGKGAAEVGTKDQKRSGGGTGGKDTAKAGTREQLGAVDHRTKVWIRAEIEKVTHAEEKYQIDTKWAKIREWKEKMRSGVKEVSRWLKRAKSTACPEVKWGKQVSTNPQEALEFIRKHWRQTWKMEGVGMGEEEKRRRAEERAEVILKELMHRIKPVEWRQPTEE